MRGLESDATAATYTRAIRSFFETPGAPDIHELTSDTLVAYRGSLMVRCGLVRGTLPPGTTPLAPATARLRLNALRAFLVWVAHYQRRDYEAAGLDPERADAFLPRGMTPESIRYDLRGFKVTTTRPYEVLDDAAQIAALFAAAQAERYQPQRAVALLALCLGAGVRIAEAVGPSGVRLGDFGHDATGPYVTVRGKGHKERVIPLSPAVAAAITRYAEESGRHWHRGREDASPLFLSRNRTRGGVPTSGAMGTWEARNLVKRIAARAGDTLPALASKRLTPHALRHSYAIDLLRGSPADGRAAASVAHVSKLLGHSSPAVTGRYLDHFQRAELHAFAPSLGLGTTGAGDE